MAVPQCPCFGSCGGCDWQDIDYSRQLELKKERLMETIGAIDIPVHSGDEYGYRNRMDFVFHGGGLGLREKGAFDRFVDVKRCPISNDRLNGLLAEVRDFFSDVFYFDVRRRFGAFCYAVIRAGSRDSSVSLVLNKKDKKLDHWLSRIQEYARQTDAGHVLATFIPPNRNVSVSEEYQVYRGRDVLEEDCLGFSYEFPIQGFFQVNRVVSEKIQEHCRKILSKHARINGHFLDLFGGVGTFGITNASMFANVTVFENDRLSIRSAERNIVRNKTGNVRALLADARELETHSFPTPLCVLIDPPRGGMHPKTVKQLNRIPADVLIYVSCNPKHLCQDLEVLDRYRVASAALFDMFPQTVHLESVVELVPKGDFRV